MTERDEPTLGYASYVLIVLMVCYTLSFIDRQILSLLVAPIRRDLGISDSSVGLLQGLAFALFYTALGIPMGRIADTRSRRLLITAGVLLWSLMTALSAGVARRIVTVSLIYRRRANTSRRKPFVRCSAITRRRSR